MYKTLAPALLATALSPTAFANSPENNPQANLFFPGSAPSCSSLANVIKSDVSKLIVPGSPALDEFLVNQRKIEEDARKANLAEGDKPNDMTQSKKMLKLIETAKKTIGMNCNWKLDAKKSDIPDHVVYAIAAIVHNGLSEGDARTILGLKK